MKPISHKTLLKHSHNASNLSRYYKLANLEANRDYWSNLQPAPLLEIKETKVEKLSAGLWNFIKSNVLELRP